MVTLRTVRLNWTFFQNNSIARQDCNRGVAVEETDAVVFFVLFVSSVASSMVLSVFMAAAHALYRRPLQTTEIWTIATTGFNKLVILC